LLARAGDQVPRQPVEAAHGEVVENGGVFQPGEKGRTGRAARPAVTGEVDGNHQPAATDQPGLAADDELGPGQPAHAGQQVPPPRLGVVALLAALADQPVQRAHVAQPQTLGFGHAAPRGRPAAGRPGPAVWRGWRGRRADYGDGRKAASGW
jgi:hypothetical protein